MRGGVYSLMVTRPYKAPESCKVVAKMYVEMKGIAILEERRFFATLSSLQVPHTDRRTEAGSNIWPKHNNKNRKEKKRVITLKVGNKLCTNNYRT